MSISTPGTPMSQGISLAGQKLVGHLKKKKEKERYAEGRTQRGGKDTERKKNSKKLSQIKKRTTKSCKRKRTREWPKKKEKKAMNKIAMEKEEAQKE